MTRTPLLENHEALGTHWWVDVVVPSNISVDVLRDAAIDMITNFEKTFSRFLPTSALTQLNSKRVLHNAPSMLLDMLQRGVAYEEHTHGLFSLTVGSTLEQNGYGAANTHADISATQRTAHAQHKTLSEQLIIDGSTVRLTGTDNIDLGGIGKSYLIECLAHMLEQHGVTEYSINGGGDIVVHLQTEETCEVEHPTDSTRSIASIPLATGAICTSSPFKRQWKTINGTLQHLVNPLTGKMDARDYTESATVVAKSVVDSDVLATVFALLGSSQWHAVQDLAQHYNAQVIFCDPLGSVHCSSALAHTLQ